jgi:hypothetical protein
MRTGFRVLAFAALLVGNACVFADDVVEEEETVSPDGVVETCGHGDGLNPCRDADGETWKHADDPNYLKLDSTQQLEQSSAAVRAEDPKELEKTIQQIEDDEQH